MTAGVDLAFGVALDLLFLPAGVDGWSAIGIEGWTGSTTAGAGAETDTGVIARGFAELSGAGTGESDSAIAGGTGDISTVGGAAMELVILFFACFFFAPVIDEEIVFDSLGFCFKSYSSFETLTTFLVAGVLADGPGVPFVFVVSVGCLAGSVLDTSTIGADVGSGVDRADVDVGVDSFEAWSFRDRFLGGDLSTDPDFSSLEGS